MADLLPNKTQKVVLREDYVLTVSVSSGNVGVLCSDASVAETLSSGKKYGPYEQDMVFVLNAFSGTVATYENDQRFTSQQNVSSDKDDNGNVTAILNDDWSVAQFLFSAVGAKTEVLDIVPVGDSITNQNFQNDGLNNLFLSKGYLAQAMAYLGRGKILSNQGVSGNTTADILARIDTIIALRNTSRFRAVVMAGTNDISNGLPADTTIANLSAIYTKLIAAGIPVDAVIYPQRYNASQAQKIHQGYVAKWHRNLRIPGVRVIDPARYIEAPDGSVPSNYFFDGLMHFSGLGAGLYAWAYYLNYRSDTPPLLDTVSSNKDLVTLNVNPLLAGDNASGSNGFSYGTGFSGNGPDGGAYVSRSGTTLAATMSKVARTDGKSGDWWRFTVGTAGADGNGITASFDTIYRLRAQNTAISLNRIVIGANGAHYRVITAGTSANVSDPSASWSTIIGGTVTDGTATLQCVPTITSGMTVEAMLECVISGLTGVMGAQPRVRAIFFNTAGTQLKIIAAGAWDSGQGLMPRNYPATPMLFRSPEYTIGADFDLNNATTTAGPHIDLSATLFMDGSALPTFDVGQLALRIK